MGGVEDGGVRVAEVAGVAPPPPHPLHLGLPHPRPQLDRRWPPLLDI